MQRPDKVKSRSERFNHKLTDLSDHTKLVKETQEGSNLCPSHTHKIYPEKSNQPKKVSKAGRQQSEDAYLAGEIERVTPQTDLSCTITSGQTLTER